MANIFDPEVLQSGFREISYFYLASLGKLPAKFAPNFDGIFFLHGLRPPPPKKKTHAQNSRPSLSAFSLFTFSNPKCFHAEFLLTGRPKIWRNIVLISEVVQEPLPLKPGFLVKNRSF